jgi:hypothetical protein
MKSRENTPVVDVSRGLALRQIASFGDRQVAKEAKSRSRTHRLLLWRALRLRRMQSASSYGNIWADGAFSFEPPGKSPSMRHVNVCSACGKPQSVASVTCLWCGQPKKLFSGRLAAILKAVLSGIGFLFKRGRAVSS